MCRITNKEMCEVRRENLLSDVHFGIRGKVDFKSVSWDLEKRNCLRNLAQHKATPLRECILGVTTPQWMKLKRERAKLF